MKAPFYLSRPEDILKIRGRQRILISSSLVAFSLWNKSDIADAMREMDLAETMMEQPLRSIRPGISTNKEEGLKLWISKDFLHKLARTKGMINLAVDAWLEWGKKHRKKNVVVIGGGIEPDGYSTSIDILSFEEGVLKRVSQLSIHSKDSGVYADELADLIQREGFGDASVDREIHIAQTLLPKGMEFNLPQHEVIPASFINRPRLSSINFGYQRLSISDLILPIALIGLAVSYGGSQIMVHRSALYAAKEEFQLQVGPVKDAYAAGEGALSLLQAKQSFMEKESPVKKKSQELERVFAAISQVNGIAVTGIAMPSEKTGYEGLVTGISDISKEADFFMQMAIRESEDKSILEQTEPVLRRLSALIGGPMKLHGMSRDSSVLDTVRVRGLNIEGNFPESSPDGATEE